MKPAVKWPLISGIALTISGAVVGLGGSILSFIRTFSTVAQPGVSDPGTLNTEMSNALISTMIGGLIGALGLALLVVALIIHLTASKQSSREDVLLENNV